jgi:uncharacterized protein
MEIVIMNQHLLLFPQKAMYWREERILFISDAHFGKITHFRQAGIPVPAAAILNNFQVLDGLLLEDVRKVIFTGDLFHSQMNSEWIMFSEWRNKYPMIEMTVVRGNHDLFLEQQYEAAGLSVYEDELIAGPFVITHHPRHIISSQFIIAGHIHPIIRLFGKANQSLRLPCFHLSSGQLILPSFGYFTGGYEISTTPGDRVFIVTGERIIEWKVDN